MIFESSKVRIIRKTFSSTQWEVEVFYGEERVGQFGDQIKLVDGAWVGLSEDVWVSIARCWLRIGLKRAYDLAYGAVKSLQDRGRAVDVETQANLTKTEMALSEFDLVEN